MIDERHAERDRSLLGGHAEGERSGIGLVPQKAAQQMQSDATTRFMPVLASPLPL